MEEEEESYRSKTNRILLEISKLNKELEELQNSCKHEEIKIELINFTLVRKCLDCGLILGYPNEQERKNSGYI